MGTARKPDPADARCLALFRAIARKDQREVRRRLDEHPELSHQGIAVGASRASPSLYFIAEIAHHIYTGDTALHIAAAAYACDVAGTLLANSADPMAVNRRGARPLHYACDGNPGSATWDPVAQSAMVECLIRAGADPDAPDANGATPLHRAVRTRCASAVQTLLRQGAAPRSRNRNGSTPLHLAVQGTGRGGVGAAETQAQQVEIIRLLLRNGAKPTDRDRQGKSVRQCLGSEWLRELFAGREPV